MTALVVQEILGGDLLLADVLNQDGSRQGVHYWNRLAGGLEVDLTREQFTPSEIIQTPQVVDRPDDLTTGRLYPQYRALADAIQATLGADIDPHGPVARTHSPSDVVLPVTEVSQLSLLGAGAGV